MNILLNIPPLITNNNLTSNCLSTTSSLLANDYINTVASPYFTTIASTTVSVTAFTAVTKIIITAVIASVAVTALAVLAYSIYQNFQQAGNFTSPSATPSSGGNRPAATPVPTNPRQISTTNSAPVTPVSTTYPRPALATNRRAAPPADTLYIRATETPQGLPNGIEMPNFLRETQVTAPPLTLQTMEEGIAYAFSQGYFTFEVASPYNSSNSVNLTAIDTDTYPEDTNGCEILEGIPGFIDGARWTNMFEIFYMTGLYYNLSQQDPIINTINSTFPTNAERTILEQYLTGLVSEEIFTERIKGVNSRISDESATAKSEAAKSIYRHLRENTPLRGLATTHESLPLPLTEPLTLTSDGREQANCLTLQVYDAAIRASHRYHSAISV